MWCAAAVGECIVMAARSFPRVIGTGLIALDIVVGERSGRVVGAWAGGTCGNVLAILAWLGWEAYPVARMNGDAASERVCGDLAQWGVHLDWAKCLPAAHTPMVVQRNVEETGGRRNHRFVWSCHNCGSRLPRFKAITRDAVKVIEPEIGGTSVFFFDRPSRGTLTLAAAAAARGAVVMFEPSGNCNVELMTEAISVAHIVKYAEGWPARVYRRHEDGATPLLEIHTLGEGGLRYRHRFGRRVSRWVHRSAFSVSRLEDACGSGDWCTAGLIARVAVGGHAGLVRAGARGVGAALTYGQALAAWNCGFQGARGGMYLVDRVAFDEQIGVLMDTGRLEPVCVGRSSGAPSEMVACPAC